MDTTNEFLAEVRQAYREGGRTALATFGERGKGQVEVRAIRHYGKTWDVSVSWPSCGSVSVEFAKEFAENLAAATSLAETAKEEFAALDAE